MVRRYVKKEKCSNCSEFLKIKIRKKYFSHSRHGQYRYFKLLFSKLEQIAKFAFTIGLRLLPVTFCSISREDVPFKKQDLKINNNDNNESILFKSMKSMDVSLLSFNRYQLFRSISGIGLATVYGIQRMRNIINSIISLKKNDFGFYFEPKEKIRYVLSKKIKDLKSLNLLPPDNTFTIKFCGDGTNLGKKNVKIVNLCFTIIEDETATSVNGTFVLGILFIFIILKIIINYYFI